MLTEQRKRALHVTEHDKADPCGPDSDSRPFPPAPSASCAPA